MPNLIILSGLPGCGKTTLGHALVKAFSKTVMISSDAVRLGVNSHPKYTIAESKETFERVRVGVARSLYDGLDVIVDATNLRMHNVEPIVNMGTIHHALVYIIHIYAPKEERVQRILQRTYPDPHGTIKASEKMEKYIDLDPEIVSLWLDGTQPVEELVSLVQGVVNFNHE